MLSPNKPPTVLQSFAYVGAGVGIRILTQVEIHLHDPF